MVIGGASIASVMFANVSERKRELGTLMALGATPSMVSRMILLKASAVGLVGGFCGLTLGVAVCLRGWSTDSGCGHECIDRCRDDWNGCRSDRRDRGELPTGEEGGPSGSLPLFP